MWRSRFLGVLILSCFAVWAGRSFYLQVIYSDFLQGKGESRYKRVLEITASRGKILDRNGEILALSTPMRSIWAIPADIRLTADQIRQLANLLEMEPEEVSRRLNSDRSFVFLRRQLPPETARKIAKLRLPGIGQSTEYRRFYPSGEIAAHVVGFTGIDNRGLEGVELAFEEQLQGRAGSRSVIKDRRRKIVEDIGSIKHPRDGENIHLALDAKIQYKAYSHLRQAVVNHKAKAGSVIVVDVKTGEILALANWPTYNPNNRDNLSGPQLRNRAVTDSFEPGSTLKPFAAALALEKSKFRFDSVINSAPGRITIGGSTISDPRSYGALTVAQIIQKSSNVGMAKIATELPSRAMWEMFNSIGFGQASHLGFPGEVSGRLRPWQSWRPIEQATMAYGHGISVSLMQLARAYMVFARDGEMIPLSLTKVSGPLPKGLQIFSPQTAREMRTMLEMAVQPGGTGTRARVHGYRIAGKTGTALKVEGGQYVQRYVASFVGFAPASDPRLLVAVKLDDPQVGGFHGGIVAAPVFSHVMASALRAFAIPQEMSVQMEQGDASGRERL